MTQLVTSDGLHAEVSPQGFAGLEATGQPVALALLEKAHGHFYGTVRTAAPHCSKVAFSVSWSCSNDHVKDVGTRLAVLGRGPRASGMLGRGSTLSNLLAPHYKL